MGFTGEIIDGRPRVVNCAVSLDSAVRWHLQHNHMPVLPESLVAPACAALVAFTNRRPDELIELPAGVPPSDGRDAVAARELVDSLNLHAFFDYLAGADG